MMVRAWYAVVWAFITHPARKRRDTRVSSLLPGTRGRSSKGKLRALLRLSRCTHRAMGCRANVQTSAQPGHGTGIPRYAFSLLCVLFQLAGGGHVVGAARTPAIRADRVALAGAKSDHPIGSSGQ